MYFPLRIAPGTVIEPSFRSSKVNALHCLWRLGIVCDMTSWLCRLGAQIEWRKSEQSF